MFPHEGDDFKACGFLGLLGEGRALSLEEDEARRVAREEFSKWACFEEALWMWKSKEIWLKDGDKNTKFFQQNG